MVAPAYATDLANIIEDMASSTGWTLISSGGGGANSFTAPETDDYIQGSSCISRNPWSSSIRGMLYNASTTIASGDAVFLWWKADVAQALATEASGGIQVLIGSSTSDYRAYYVAGSDTYQLGGWRCAAIDPTSTPSTTVGSPTATTAYFGVRWNVPSSGPSKGFPFKIDAIRHGREATITAGDSGDPATWSKLGAYSADITRRWGVSTPTDTGVQAQGIVNWGSGSASVYSRDSNRTIVLLGTKGFTETSFTQIVIQHASTDLEWDNITISALGTLNRGLVSILNNAKAWLTNCTFAGLDTITDGGSNTKFDGSVFRGCNAVTSAGGTFIGCSVLAPTVAADTSSLVHNVALDTVGRLDGMSFSRGTNAHHAIELGLTSPIEVTLSGQSYSGFNAADGENDSVLHIKRTSGTVTINISGGGQVPSYKSDGATVSIVSSVDYEVSGMVVGSELSIVRLSDATVLFHVESTATGTETYSHGGTLTDVDVLVMHLDYIPYAAGDQLQNQNQTLLVQQQDDRFYSNP